MLNDLSHKLKEFEDKILGAEERRKALGLALFKSSDPEWLIQHSEYKRLPGISRFWMFWRIGRLGSRSTVLPAHGRRKPGAPH